MLSASAKLVSEIVNRYHGIEYTCEYKYDGICAQVILWIPYWLALFTFSMLFNAPLSILIFLVLPHTLLQKLLGFCLFMQIHCMDDGSIWIFNQNLECCTDQYPDVKLAVKRLFSINIIVSVKTLSKHPLQMFTLPLSIKCLCLGTMVFMFWWPLWFSIMEIMLFLRMQTVDPAFFFWMEKMVSGEYFLWISKRRGICIDNNMFTVSNFVIVANESGGMTRDLRRKADRGVFRGIMQHWLWFKKPRSNLTIKESDF